MTDRGGIAVTLLTVAAVSATGVLVAKRVTQEQLNAMEQCVPACQTGNPLLSGPWEIIAPVLLLVSVALMITSVVSGWPVAGAQMRL